MDLPAGGGIRNIAVQRATEVNLMNLSQEFLRLRRVSSGRVISYAVQPTMPEKTIKVHQL